MNKYTLKRIQNRGKKIFKSEPAQKIKVKINDRIDVLINVVEQLTLQVSDLTKIVIKTHKNQHKPDELLTIQEAAAFLNLKPQTLYGYTSQFKIPFLKQSRKLYFSKQALEKWVKESEFKPKN